MRRRDYLLSVKPKRRRRNVRNLPAIRRGEIERHARYVGAADTEDLWRWLVAWCWHNGQNGRDPTGALKLAAERMGGDLTEANTEAILERADATRQRRTADKLAKFLGVTDRQRTAVGIMTIGSIDVDRKQRNRRRGERQRMNRERRRRARGARPRTEYEESSLMRAKPWEAEDISRATWYRRRRETGPPTPIPPLKGGGSSETSPPTPIFLMAEDTPVSPERKQGAFREGDCPKGTAQTASPTSLVLENGVLLTRRWIAARERLCGCRHNGRSAVAETPTNQEDEMSKPWEAEGISRATWYRRHHETAATETVRQAGETETETETETVLGETAPEMAPERVPETTQPAADATTLHKMPADLSDQQRQDAERYFARWGDQARAYGWTAAQQDKLIRQIAGREVKQLTDTQALVGNKVYYRFQLSHA